MIAQRQLWEGLHAQPRHQLRYPNEDAVRFVAGLVAGQPQARVLDLGCGAGRHLALLEAEGLRRAHGTDISVVGLRCARARAPQAQLCAADMSALPYRDESFDAALAVGVLYYSSAREAAQAFAELHRVLRPGAPAFLLLKSVADQRCGQGEAVEAGTWRISPQLPGSPAAEAGMLLHFFDYDELEALCAPFAQRRIEATLQSVGGLQRMDASWRVYLCR